MAARPKTIFEFLNLFGGELSVFHVAKVGFVVSSPFVQVDEMVFWDLEGEGCEMVERVEDFLVQVLESSVSMVGVNEGEWVTFAKEVISSI